MENNNDNNNKDNINNSNFERCPSPPAGGASPPTISGSSNMESPSPTVVKNDDGDIDCSSPPELAAISGSSIMETPTSGVDSEIDTLFKNVTPPKIAAHVCSTLAEEFQIDWDSCSNDEKRVLWFLFDRNAHKVLEEESKEQDKKSAVEGMLRQAMDANSEIGARVRVMVLERGQDFFTSVPDDVQIYDLNFLQELPVWAETGISSDFINLLQDPDMEVFQQVQMSGNCYLHAAVLAYHYYACWHGLNNAQYQNIVIPRYMRHAFTAADIYNHLFQGEGGRSENILAKLAGRKEIIPLGLLAGNSKKFRSTQAKFFLKSLELFGPLLFSNALLPEDFLTLSQGDLHSLTGTFMLPNETNDQEEFQERHAMVLMGIRKGEGEDNWFFLFQNSHKQNQFFEADYDWVANTGGSFYANVQDRGAWRPPISTKQCVHNQFAVYSQASPSVDRPDSSDKTKSFTY